MDPQADFPPTSQTPNGTHASGTDDPEILRRRIRHLENQIQTYEQLLEDLPDLFERKFRQRLGPLLERYRLLEQRLDADGQNTRPPALVPCEELSSKTQPNQVIRLGPLPLPRLPRLPRRRSV